MKRSPLLLLLIVTVAGHLLTQSHAIYYPGENQIKKLQSEFYSSMRRRFVCHSSGTNYYIESQQVTKCIDFKHSREDPSWLQPTD